MKEGVRMVRVRDSFKDAKLLALDMEEGTMSQGTQVACRSWK